MTTETKDEKQAGATKRPEELLMPPDGYRLSTLDASTGNAHIMFKLYGQREKDWHLSGEVLNSAGEDTREELYLSRTIKDFSSFLDTLRARSELLDEATHIMAMLLIQYEMNLPTSGVTNDERMPLADAKSLLTRIKESA